ncbi:RrF2 family transcriptional regulator [Helicobacter burdigaliensis]|uniref:RrF2 family transcriptional regulator n=1 Tax=Helicobacter burdigaliensis TaxID=2315334 RepID=UPI000EF6E6AA|nr:Rrf2 family transcriptional regulator [Helicobacter burdigaliensis]
MATISTKGIYGLEALYYLALHKQKLPIGSRTMAKDLKISCAYLEQILMLLKQGGILEGIKGPKGGYKFAKNLNAIKVIEALEILEQKKLSLGNSKNKALAIFWEEIDTKIKSILDLSLEELIKYEEKLQIEGMYFI